jgi:hypothetical protein
LYSAEVYKVKTAEKGKESFPLVLSSHRKKGLIVTFGA